MSNTPLTPAVFHILLALARGEKHGYGIMKQVQRDSRSRVKMGSGTLYGSIKRMLASALIADGIPDEYGDKIDHLIVSEAPSGKADLLADGIEDSLLNQIPAQEHNFAKPAGRRGHRLRRGLDSNRARGNTGHGASFGSER